MEVPMDLGKSDQIQVLWQRNHPVRCYDHLD